MRLCILQTNLPCISDNTQIVVRNQFLSLKKELPLHDHITHYHPYGPQVEPPSALTHYYPHGLQVLPPIYYYPYGPQVLPPSALQTTFIDVRNDFHASVSEVAYNQEQFLAICFLFLLSMQYPENWSLFLRLNGNNTEHAPCAHSNF